MKQSEFTVLSNQCIALSTYRMCLEGDTSDIRCPGQFVNLTVEGFFLRRPFAVQKWDAKTMTLIYKVVGEGTEKLSKMEAGQTVQCLVGLGNGFDASACHRDALVICGGLGASPAFSLTKQLVLSGKNVTVILGFNTSSEIVLYDEYRVLGADVRIVTMDGSNGLKGLVTDAVDALNPRYDYFYTCGPKVMMKAVCEKLTTGGEASLEERMGCGCGICYGCTCHTKHGPARVCVDGPVFKKEDIVW